MPSLTLSRFGQVVTVMKYNYVSIILGLPRSLSNPPQNSLVTGPQKTPLWSLMKARIPPRCMFCFCFAHARALNICHCSYSMLTDLDFVRRPLNRTLFPGIPANVLVHRGFADQHEMTATIVLSEVKKLLSSKNAQKVILVWTPSCEETSTD